MTIPAKNCREKNEPSPRGFPRAGLYVWEHREDAASTFSYVIYDTIHKEELKTWILH